MPDTGYFDQSANVGLVSTGGIRTLTANIDSLGDGILSNILLATSGESFYFDSNSSMSLGLNAPVPVRTLTANIDSSGDSILSNILLATSGESFYFDSNSSMSLGLNAPVPVRTLTTVMPTEFKRTAISGSELQRFTD